MTDEPLIARLRGYIGKASFATGADRYTVTTLLDELAAALAREQEAQPAAQEPSRLTDAQIGDIVREASKGAATRRDGTTSTRIARAVEAALAAQPSAQEKPHG
jgi:hypothetical protein